MKIIFAVISVCTCLGFSTLNAQDIAINFIKEDYEKALKVAAIEGKIVFVDAYTTWCGPCKMMDAQVFTDTIIGAFFNEHFVNLKLDMESGDGIALAKKHKVDAYPSFLFLDKDGNLLHRGLGFQPVDKFLELGKKAIDPDFQLHRLKKIYESGDRSSNLLKRYALALLRAGEKEGKEIGAEYLKTKESWTEREDLEIVLSIAEEYQDPYYQDVVDRKHLYIREFGQSAVYGRLTRMIEDYLYQDMDNLNLKEAREIYDNTFPTSKAEPFYDSFVIDYYDSKGDTKKYIEATKDYVKKYPMLSWSALNGLAWNFYERVEDPKSLKKAVKWAKKSISIESNHYNNDTLAALYYKLGKKGAATKYAERAIKLAKEAGADYAETEGLLKEINKLP